MVNFRPTITDHFSSDVDKPQHGYGMIYKYGDAEHGLSGVPGCVQWISSSGGAFLRGFV